MRSPRPHHRHLQRGAARGRLHLSAADSRTPSHRFFGGKGGVGKTTCAAAAAAGAAARGERVLLVSTDPAHSLGDVVDARLGGVPRALRTGSGTVFAAELDAERALARFLARRRPWLAAIAERGSYLDRSDVDQLLDLSLPGVDELIGMIEIRRLARAARYDRVIVDTAPTGHMLRLLAMPRTLEEIASVFDRLQEKHRALSVALTRRYRADAGDRVIDDLARTADELRALLQDPERCRFSWVLLPQPMAIAESQDGVRALEQLGIAVDEVIVNRMLPPGGACARCTARRAGEERALEQIAQEFGGKAIRVVPERLRAPRGIRGLGAIARDLARPPVAPARVRRRARALATSRALPVASSPPAWLEDLAPAARRLLMFGGKGGVGKTTCAAAAGLWIARSQPRRRVLLLSVDPAHSLGDCLGARLGDRPARVAGAPANLRARDLYAAHELARLRARYQASIDRLLEGDDAAGLVLASDRAALRELIEIAPPGLDELVAVLAVMRTLLARKPRFDLVVMDLAPTGHALRLLELPQQALEWTHVLLAIMLKYREAFGLGPVAGELLDLSHSLRDLLALLGDPERTAFVVVARPERMVRLETERLLRILGERSVPVGALLVNAVSDPLCPRCGTVARDEEREIARLAANAMRSDAGAAAVLLRAPAVAPLPEGVAALLAFGRTWHREVRRSGRPAREHRRAR